MAEDYIARLLATDLGMGNSVAQGANIPAPVAGEGEPSGPPLATHMPSGIERPQFDPLAGSALSREPHRAANFEEADSWATQRVGDSCRALTPPTPNERLTASAK